VIGRTSIELGVFDVETRARFVEALKRDGVVRRAPVRFSDGKTEREILFSAQTIELAGQHCVLAQSEEILR
jgi:hypothetical protein